ncbi:NAD-dependent epimerase/dehydratase family protein, partial [bacterium]|nr:NAD-dependent epimerase/dehydratase family protein [bacterium]
RSLIAEIRRRLPEARILGIDLRSADGDPPDEFHQGDIAAPRQAEAVCCFGPDTLVHLAYAVQPGRDAAALRATNVDGTRAVLDVAAAVQPRRLLVASSATIYGAWPDNPPACDETTPIRPLAGYYYSAHKGLVERCGSVDQPIGALKTRPELVQLVLLVRHVLVRLIKIGHDHRHAHGRIVAAGRGLRLNVENDFVGHRGNSRRVVESKSRRVTRHFQTLRLFDSPT